MLKQSKHYKEISVKKALKLASSRFEGAGIENSLGQAELLLCSILNCSRSSLYTDVNRILLPEELRLFESCIKKKVEGMPLQYIIHRQKFRYLDLQMREGVFIPRPETELLAGLVIDFVRSLRSPFVIDLGTGSGAIALSVAYEVPGSKILAIDWCKEALSLAEENAKKHDLLDSISFIQGNLLEELDNNLVDSVDVIVSNPPYIESEAIKKLMREVKDHEPIAALDGGQDGFAIIRKIITESIAFLKPEGLLAMEIGKGQSSKVAELIDSAAVYRNIDIQKDYAGIDRIIKAVKLRES